MTRMPAIPDPPDRRRPVERFLGPEEAAGGPFALLALNPTALTDDLILSALDRQIERVNRHPECDTPEADEVRLALHAAAAQLLDPIVRRHLIAKWSGTPAAPPPRPAPAASPAPIPATPRRSDTSEKLLEADAILALALYGGWNHRAMRRLLKVAHARGMTNAQVAATLRNLAGRRRSVPAAPSRASLPMRRVTPATHPPRPTAGPSVARAPTAPPASAAAPSRPSAPGMVLDARQTRSPQRCPLPEPFAEEQNPAAQTLRNAAIFGGVGLAALATAAVAIIALASKTTPPAPPAPTPAPAPASGTRPATPPPPPPTPTRTEKPNSAPAPRTSTEPMTPAALMRELAACAEAAPSQPEEATARFETAVERLAGFWHELPRDLLIATHDAVIEFIYKVGDAPDLAIRAVTAVGRPATALGRGSTPKPAEVIPAVWSTGMLVRLSRERDLSAAAKSTVESHLGLSLGPTRPAMEHTFESGAAAALSLLPQRLTPAPNTGAQGVADANAWKQWARAVDAFAGGDAAVALRMLLPGLEVLLIQGPEPDVNRDVAAIIADLIQRITWRAEDDSRRWLLRWFDDRRVTSADLHAITSALATRSSADGVDLTMVLSTAASENARAELRDRYATVWGMEAAVDRDELTSEWAAAARDAVANSLSGGDDIDALAAAVVLARLSEAASWQWRGDGGQASLLLADLHAPVEQALVVPPAGTGRLEAEDLSDGNWAERYLSQGQRVRLKREMLDQLLVSGSTLGPVDAEVIARDAFFSGNSELRTPAQELIRSYAGRPAVINAVLELLPKMPRSAANASVVEVVAGRPLPSFRRPDWHMAARRALVERLLEAVASESPMARVDRLATLLAVSYRAMAAPAPLSYDQRRQATQPPAFVSAAELWQQWRATADSVVLTSPPALSLDQIDRRRAGRVGQAKGMVQAFSAEQTSLCEIMAYVIQAEQPARADQVKDVLARMTDDRRHARTIFRQICATERAIIQLWLIRYQEDPA